MTFNSVLTSYSTKVNSQVIDASDVNNPQTDITQIEAIMGVAGDSSVVGTYEYFIKSPGSDGGGHIQGVNKGGTNTTSYNKGDILIAKSSSVLTKLAVGNDNQVLTASSVVATGVMWANFPGTPVIRVFSVASGALTSSVLATWNKPSILSYIVLEIQGGGGAGGGANGTAYGSGGGGGGYLRKIITASALPGNQASIITAGGGLIVSADTGKVGQNSSFNFNGPQTSVIALGGGGGVGGAVSNQAGASGGSNLNGDLMITGGAGGRSGANGTGAAYGGFGGSAVLGGSVPGAENGANGVNGQNYGGGGSGASTTTTAGNGGPGVVIIYEY